MQKQALIEALEDSRIEFIEILDEVGDDALDQGGVASVWSVRDILAHLAFWEGQMVALLFHAARSTAAPDLPLFTPDQDAINARQSAQNAERSFDAIYADFIGVRKQLVRRVREWREADLNDAARFPYLEESSLADWIERVVLDHEALHLEQIGDWVERQEAGRQENKHLDDQNNGAAPHA